MVAALAGTLALWGWMLGIKALTSVLPGLATMKPNTALCFVMAGLSLWLIQLPRGELSSGSDRRIYIARVFSGLIAAVGLLTVTEYLFRLNFGIDNILFHRALQATEVLHPGRMSGATALGFLFLGGSMLLLSDRRPYAAQSLAVLAALNGFVACMGYLLGAHTLYDIPAYSSMAVHTAFLFIALGIAILTARPRFGMMAALISECMGGVMARRVLPLAVVVPILFGWLRWRGQTAGLYGTEFGIALRTLAEVVTFATLVYVIAVWMNQIDQDRREDRRRNYDLAAIVASSNDAMISLDLAGAIVRWNRGAEELFGYRAEEILGRPIATIIPPEVQEEAGQFLGQVRHGLVVAHDQTVRRRKDGRLVHVSLIISPVRDFEARIVGSSAIVQDISERKRSEEVRERLAAVVESSDDAIVGKNLDGIITAWNSGAERLFGYSSSEAMGQPISMLLPPDRANEEADILARVRRGESLKHFETVRVRKDGTHIEVSATISPIKDRSGAIIGASKIARDITEHKRAARRLQESEQNYRMLFDSMSEGFCVIEVLFNENDEPVDYRFLEVNPAFEKQTGIQNAPGKRMREIAPRHEQHWFEIYGKIALTGEPARFENVAAQLHSCYEVHAFRVGEPQERKVAIFFTDITDRKRAEVELVSSRQALEDKTLLLQSVLDSMSEGLVVADEKGKFIIWNPAAEKIVGLGPADISSRDWTEHYGLFLTDKVTPFPPELNPLARAIQGDAGTAVMFLRRPEFNEGIFVEALGSPLKDKHGIVRGGISAFRDVTERVKAEERLREYARVVEGLEEMILVVDRQYRYLIANKAFLNFRGMSAEQVIGRRADEVVSKDIFAELVKDKMDECFLGKVVQYEMTYAFPNLGNRDLAVSYFPIEGPTGIDRIACVLQDITNRKLAEESLRKSEERFSKAFRNSPLAITISTEADGRYLDVNEAFLGMVGHQRRDVIGHTSADLKFWADPLARVEMLRLLKEEDRVAKLQVQYKTKNGKIREAELWVESIELDGQRCVLGILRDVTEVRALEAQFRQAQKMEAVGRLAGGVAHDFNNILGIIMGYSDISLGLAPQGPIETYLSEIKKASQRAALLTRQLLEFSRQQVVFPKVLDLNSVVHNVTSMLLRLVGEDVEVEFLPAASIGSIKADPGQLEQVLMNLVVNARDAMTNGGKIIIGTAPAELDEHYASRHADVRAGQYVVLAVSDTGCGMDEKTKSQIFEPFFTTKAVGKGTGLGLSTVYGIVKQAEGHVLVYSEPGKGTTFKLYFPRVREKAEELVSRKDQEPPRGTETILVVEDDKDLRHLTVKLLQDGGYRVVEAKDAEEALRLLEVTTPPIDLLLSDVVMPGKSGVELLEQARISHPSVRSLFMSGYAGDLVALRGAMKAASFLEKPFTRNSLLMKVYSAMHPGST